MADLTGKVVGEYELPHPAAAPGHASQRVIEAARRRARRAPGSTRAGCTAWSIGTPGAFDPTHRRLRYARHLPGWHDPDLLARWPTAVGVPRRGRERRQPRGRRRAARSAAPRASTTSCCSGRDEGIGAAIVIDGRLHRGATGGAGEVGFLPLPGTPLVRNVGRSNAGGFQELAGGKQVLALARALGLRADAPQAAVAAALTTPGAGDAAAGRARRTGWRVGLAAIVAVRRPRARSCSPAVSSAPAANGSRPRPGRAGRPGRSPARRRAVRAYPRTRSCTGALHSALAATRDEVFDTLQTSPTHSVTT